MCLVHSGLETGDQQLIDNCRLSSRVYETETSRQKAEEQQRKGKGKGK
jgi:hypothetical protein